MNLKLQLFVFFCILILFSFNDLDGHEGIEKSDEWISLFNGKDLQNWTPKIKGYEPGDNHKNTFTVESGVLRVDYQGYEEFNETYGHLFYKLPFDSYKLRLEYRFTGQQLKGGEDWAIKNSGVMIHSQAPETMELNQDFPVCVEVQLLGGIETGKKRPTANVCTPGTHIEIADERIEAHCINSSSDTYYGEQWVGIEITVYKDSLITHSVNGEEVLRYGHPVIGGEYNTLPMMEGEALTGGYIALQSESHPVEFRNIWLKKLGGGS